MWEVFLILPMWFQLSFLFVLGAIIGSFLDVFLMRFHTGYSINGRSHCCSCGSPLRWYELLPVVSYLIQHGRCRSCGAHIPLRLLLMEVGFGTLFTLVFLSSNGFLSFFLVLFLSLLLALIAIYDLRHFVIPDIMVVGVCLVAIALVIEAYWEVFTWTGLVPHFFSGLIASGFLASLWLVSRGRWIGLGDAKLAAPLGFLLGPLGAFSFIVLSFWIGAVISVVLLGFQQIHKRGQPGLSFLSIPITMKTEVPFAPFMVMAFVAVYFLGVDVLHLFSYWFYGS